MSQVVFTGFVVVDDDDSVLPYEQLRNIGFIGPTAEAEYLAGMHGINGLFQIRVTPKQTELMDDQGLSLAKIVTPYFPSNTLSAEPEIQLEIPIEDRHGEIIDLEYFNGFTKVSFDEGSDETLVVRGKLSISMYHTNTPQPEIDLLSAIGWNSVAPVMPSPADVLAQLGSQKSLADQFAEAFASAQPAPPKAPEWVPPTPAPWATQPQMAPAPKPAPAYAQPNPVPTPEPVKQPVQSGDDLVKSMFGLLLG